MDDDIDPALQFFPDGQVDLYGALGVEKDAKEEEIKKAYRRYVCRSMSTASIAHDRCNILFTLPQGGLAIPS